MANRFNDRIQSYLADEEPRRPLFAQTKTHSPTRISILNTETRVLSPIQSTLDRRFSNTSTGSSASSYRSSDRSLGRQYSTSSAGTSISVPPWHPPTLLQQINMHPFDYGYNLPCEFLFVDCNMRFNPSDFEAWISHAASHLGDSLPTVAICTFCDEEFHSTGDNERNWRDRMVHIGGHLEERASFDDTRPDFWIIDHMKKHGLISTEDYDHALKGTERPYLANTYALVYETPDMLEKRRKESQAPYDIREEERQRRKGKTPKRSHLHPHRHKEPTKHKVKL